MFTKGTDKFLIAIVVGVIVLVGAAFLMVLLRPAPSYHAEDTPEGVVHNYLFALQQKDYARAYGYLSKDLRGRPQTAARFQADIWGSYRFTSDSSTTWLVQVSNTTGDYSTVNVQQTRYYGGSLFGSSQYTYDSTVRLRLENGAWKIYDADIYWLDCWDKYGGCS